MARKKFSVKKIFKRDDMAVLQEDENTVIQKEKGKKSFNIEKDVLNDLELLAWYFNKTYSEVAEEAFKTYIEHKKEVVKKAREMWVSR